MIVVGCANIKAYLGKKWDGNIKQSLTVVPSAQTNYIGSLVTA